MRRRGVAVVTVAITVTVAIAKAEKRHPPRVQRLRQRRCAALHQRRGRVTAVAAGTVAIGTVAIVAGTVTAAEIAGNVIQNAHQMGLGFQARGLF